MNQTEQLSENEKVLTEPQKTVDKVKQFNKHIIWIPEGERKREITEQK